MSELIADVKHKLGKYRFYKDQVSLWEDKQGAIIDEMIRTQGSVIKPPDVQKVLDIHKNTPLWDKYYHWGNNIKINNQIIAQVDSFIRRLPEENDKKMIDDYYINNLGLTQENVAKKYSYQRRGLQDRINALIKEYWRY